ncbi:MAG: AarF/ABC1/UbiB kinase family protein, partial [Cyanobacteria bacterium J06627_15]
KEIDKFGYGLLIQLRGTIQETLRDPAKAAKTVTQARSVPAASNWEHLVRILGILRDTPGFDAATVAQLLPKLLTKPETRHLGQRVVGGVMQRALARLIREVVLRDRPVQPALKPAN